MGLSGWSPEAVQFFQGLQADNTTPCLIAHKAFCETSVREPLAALLDDLSGEFGPGPIARPYRDVRFRAGKPPYKTAACSASCGRSMAGLTSTTGVPPVLGWRGSPKPITERDRQAVLP